jgi:endonuclease/exonuclease/phosphatase family metal-dependent hydrolase
VRLLALCALALLLPALAEAGQPISAMTFNIRAAGMDRQELSWGSRRPRVAAVIRAQNLDVVGLQEAKHSQLMHLLEDLPHFAATGVGREDGKAKGEFSAILYRRDRFIVAESTSFWLSPTPDIPGSVAAPESMARVATRIRLLDRDGSAVWVYNAHLSNRSAHERRLALIAIAARVDAHDDPVILTGDLNAGGEELAAAQFLQPLGSPSPRLVDTLPPALSTGTAHGFVGRRTGRRIDYVLTSPGTRIERASIVPTANEVSDHYPVVATLSWR